MSLSIHYLISLLTIFITTFFLGIFVYIKNKKSNVNIAFALYSETLAIWGLGQGLHSIAPTKALALFWGRFGHVGIVFIPSTLLHFIFNFLEIKGPKRKIINIAYTISFFFLVTNFVNGLYITDAVPKFSLKYFIKPGVFYLPSVLFFAVCTVYGLLELFKAYISSSGAKRNQLKYLCWGLLVGYIGGPSNFLLVFGIQIVPLNPFGTYTVPIYTFIIAYAILKYRLMDITVFAVRTIILSVVYGILLFLPLFTFFTSKSSIDKISIGAYALLVSFAPFIFMYLRQRAESRLLAKKGARQDKLRDLSRFMMRFTRLKTLAGLIVHNVLKILELKHVALYLLEVDNNKPKQYNLIASYVVPKRDGLPKNISFDSVLAKALTYQKIAIEHEEIKHKVASTANHNLSLLEQELIQLKVHIIIPTFLRSQLMGFLILGESKTNEIFTKEDINVLQVLSNQAALAIENALFWQRDEEKLVESSKEEAASAVSFGAGHQFNNRLYAISMTVDGIFDSLGERDIEQMTAEEIKPLFKRALTKLKKISEECQFGGEITAGIMSLTGTAPPNFTEFDISPIITSSLELVEMKHSKDKIEGNKPPVLITSPAPKTLPLIFGSDAQVRDCLFNLIDNAYDAAYEKDTKIKERNPELNWPQDQVYNPLIEIKASVKDNYLVINITDNGIGIKEEDKKRIFAGFFTTKATSVKGYGPGGHGIGVFTVKKLISAHKGKIYFTSEYGKGTTFTIELPLVKKENNSHNA